MFIPLHFCQVAGMVSKVKMNDMKMMNDNERGVWML